MEPLVIDAFTSEAGSSEPKKVFYVGDSISWNVVHAAQHPELVGENYRLTVILREIGQHTWVDDRNRFGFIWRVQRHLSNDWSDLWPATFEWFSVGEIPRVPLSVDLGPSRDLQPILDQLGSDRFDFVFTPTVWGMTAILEMTGAAANGEFSVKADWYYRILAYRPPI